MEHPPKKFYRLSPGKEVRLRYGYFVTCREMVKDDAGQVVALRCTYDPALEGRQRAGRAQGAGDVALGRSGGCRAGRDPALHASVQPSRSGAEGDVLADINPESLEVLTGALVEPALADTPVGEAVQFERTGYFAIDPDSRPGRLVFNRTVGLRDTWAKDERQGISAAVVLSKSGVRRLNRSASLRVLRLPRTACWNCTFRSNK